VVVTTQLGNASAFSSGRLKPRNAHFSSLAPCSATAVWIANFNSSCTLHAVGEVIQEWGAAFGFPKGTSNAMLDAWNRNILTIQQDTDLEDVFKVRRRRPGCSMGPPSAKT
jgi:hypothetical protein